MEYLNYLELKLCDIIKDLVNLKSNINNLTKSYCSTKSYDNENN